LNPPQTAGPTASTTTARAPRTNSNDSNAKYLIASNETRYRIRSFTFLLAIADEFVSTPSSLKFLVEHGFDFNLLFTAGIPYQRAKGVCDGIY
jgi:hypothetical protein